MADLTPVPATLPGVVRRGTPVVAAHAYDPGPRARGVVVEVAADGAALVAFGTAFGTTLRWVRLDELHVDMEDPAGRTHVAWAVAAWWETTRGAGAPSAVPLTGCSWRPLGCRSWLLAWSGCGVVFEAWESAAPTFVDVPTLARLSSSDPRTLDDGSSWADAEAEALVAVHVLGGAS